MVKKITKSELFATLYNSCMPFGMGLLQGNDDTLTVSEVEQILNKSNYFDYYKGVALKIGFESFSNHGLR